MHRLWQMEFYRRVGAGRLSEVAGNATLNIDRYFRMLGLRRVAQRTIERRLLSAQTMAIIQAFCDGVNDFVESAQYPLPIEFALVRRRRKDEDEKLN